MKPALVVMAAGMGSRYGGLKQIDPVGPHGEIVIEYSVYDALRAGFGRVVFIIRRDIEAPFRAVIDRAISRNARVDYAFQELGDLPAGFRPPPERTKPWGTGHAILSVRQIVHEPFAVINADDFYGREAFHAMAQPLTQASADSTEFYLAGYRLSETLSEHGAVSRGICEVDDHGFLRRVVERTHIEKRNGKIVAQTEKGLEPISPDTTVSMNFWGFTPALFPHLERVFVDFLRANSQSPKAELAIPTIIDGLVAEGVVRVRVVPTTARWLGMTYPEDKPVVRDGIAARIRSGEYPSPLWGG
ncbi:MAG: nucleotidyltransferase [Kiritimatiellae bacterium]|nr:nucleotidyltransferase [Kiritimatiellia bacterium]MDW8458488.1 nucleotidyltransferase [Verrucomicrobiota bacterium]